MVITHVHWRFRARFLDFSRYTSTTDLGRTTRTNSDAQVEIRLRAASHSYSSSGGRPTATSRRARSWTAGGSRHSSYASRRSPAASRGSTCDAVGGGTARQPQVAVAVWGGGGVAALGGELRRHRRLGRRGRVQAVEEDGAARRALRESAARRGRAAGRAPQARPPVRGGWSSFSASRSRGPTRRRRARRVPRTP